MKRMSIPSAIALLILLSLVPHATAPLGSAPFTTRGVRAQDAPFVFDVPKPFPAPFVPADNPMNAAKVELGRRLFYDQRLSGNGKQSCASCHRQELAFTDGKASAVGATGEQHPRGSMSLANAGYNPVLTWANPPMQWLESQALVPMFAAHPIELGLGGRQDALMRTISNDGLYRRLFARAFPTEHEKVSLENITRAIAAFERTLISLRSPYDRYRYGGERDAISPAAKRGEIFFFSGQRGACFQCHGGWNFNGDVRYADHDNARVSFFNTGLYNIPGPVSYPASNTGVHAITGRESDVGKFRVPTLRNIAVTAPYMHDGSIATLGEVLDHYAAGGRTIASGPNAGVGRNNPNKAPSVHGFAMSATDKADLLAFLETLTDSTFLRNPAFANPWEKR